MNNKSRGRLLTIGTVGSGWKSRNAMMMWCALQEDHTIYLGKKPNKAKHQPHPLSPITGAPLPRGDALIAYKNLKQEKNCLGKRNGREMK
jgi:hypothetical protein